MALRSDAAAAFIAKAAKDLSIFLFHGADLGLISEHLTTTLKHIGIDTHDPFQFVRLDGDQVSDDPSLLLDEINTVGLFGATRSVRIRLGSSEISAALELAIKAPQRDWKVVIEAGELKRDSAVRRFCETNSRAVSVECAQDNDEDIAHLISDTFESGGIGIEADARELLVAALGADRLASRSELDKLLLYCSGMDQISTRDVEAISIDASTSAIDQCIQIGRAHV